MPYCGLTRGWSQVQMELWSWLKLESKYDVKGKQHVFQL